MKELDIKLGYKCNNNCIFCLNRDKKDIRKIPLKKIKSEIQSFTKESGEKKLIISGGEPLIFDSFFQVMKFAHERGINRFEIQTNGRMLSYEKIVKKIKNFEADYLGFLVSLHFPNKQLHEKYAQADGFREVISGIENLKKYNCNYTVNTVVMKQNLNRLENLVKLLIKKGVQTTQYRFIDGSNVMNKFKEFVPRYSEAVPIIKKIIKQHKEEIKIHLKEFPFCVLEKKYLKYTAPSLEPNRKNLSSKEKVINTQKIHHQQFSFPNCDNCAYKSKCPGVRNEYLKFYGKKEFKPIKKQN